MSNLEHVADGLIQILTDRGQELNDTGTSRAHLRTRIALEISRLLETDLEKLMAVFYRLDVPEQEVRAIFMTSAPNLLAVSLADIIIDRELRKIVTRKQHRSSNTSTGRNNEDEF